jgi:hypothetical protein
VQWYLEVSMMVSMVARWHRPAMAVPNCGQAGANHTPPLEKAASSTSVSRELRSTEFVDELANSRHGSTCAWPAERRRSRSSRIGRSIVARCVKRDRWRGLQPPESVGEWQRPWWRRHCHGIAQELGLGFVCARERERRGK